MLRKLTEGGRGANTNEGLLARPVYTSLSIGAMRDIQALITLMAPLFLVAMAQVVVVQDRFSMTL